MAVRNENRFFIIHNTFIEIAAESGILALMAFCLLLYHCFKTIKKSRYLIKEKVASIKELLIYITAIRISIFAYIIMAMTISIRHNRILYIFIGMIICLNRIIYNEMRRDDGKKRNQGENPAPRSQGPI